MRLKALFLLAIAPAAFATFVNSPGALNADSPTDWSLLASAGDLGTPSDDPFDLPTGYGQIPVTTVSFVEITSASSYGIPDSTDVLLNDSDAQISMTFPNVYGVGFYIANQLAGSFTPNIQAFGAGNTLLESFSGPSTDGSEFIGVLDAIPDITQIIISTTQNTTDDAFVLGNISVNLLQGPAVPEPSTLLLAGSALAIMAWRNKVRAREWRRRLFAATRHRN